MTIPTRSAEHRSEKWTWCMDWCQKKRLPPGNQDIWEMAKEAYHKEFLQRPYITNGREAFDDAYFINSALVTASRHLDELEREAERRSSTQLFSIRAEFERIYEQRTGRKIPGLKHRGYQDEL